MTDLSFVKSKLAARIGRDITDYIVVPFFQLKIGDFNVNVIDYAEYNDIREIWKVFYDFASGKDIKADGLAVVNYKLDLTYDNHISPRPMDLICDVTPRVYIHVSNAFLYDSDVFTRENPLNMMSSSVVFGGAKIWCKNHQTIECKATIVFLINEIRDLLSKMFYPHYGFDYLGDALSVEKVAHILSNL